METEQIQTIKLSIRHGNSFADVDELTIDDLDFVMCMLNAIRGYREMKPETVLQKDFAHIVLQFIDEIKNDDPDYVDTASDVAALCMRIATEM